MVKVIFFPLTPFLVGLLFRFIKKGSITWDSINTGELSISMAIMCIVVAIAGSRIKDKRQGDHIAYLFIFGLIIIIFIYFFTISTNIAIQTKIFTAINEAKNVLGKSLLEDEIKISELKEIIDNFFDKGQEDEIERLRTLAIIISGLIIISSIIYVKRYKLYL